MAVVGDGWQLRKVVAKCGDLPVAEAKDLHERHPRPLPAGFVERDVDLGNENVVIRGVVQDVGGPLQVHRGLVGRLLVIHTNSGPDRIAAHRTGIHVTFEYFFMCESHSPV